MSLILSSLVCNWLFQFNYANNSETIITAEERPRICHLHYGEYFALFMIREAVHTVSSIIRSGFFLVHVNNPRDEGLLTRQTLRSVSHVKS